MERQQESIRVLVLKGRGKNFCAGADIAWMKEAATLSHDANLAEAQALGEMFDRLSKLPMPTVAIAQGGVFGGGLGLLACCDIVLATPNSQFCLSEVRLGVIPAVILPHLAAKLPGARLSALALSGREFSGAQALTWGLVESLGSGPNLTRALNQLLSDLYRGGPQAQRILKTLLRSPSAEAQKADAPAAIAAARLSSEGQAGLAAFLWPEQKGTPPWVLEALNQPQPFDFRVYRADDPAPV